MSSKHTYVLGINAYDHDVSACLLRDGEIAFAINKERITRKKHDTGFYQKVVDYCLAAEGISLDDVDLVVRNCYVLPVEDLELRLVSQYVPEVMDDQERKQAKTNPLYLSRSNKVVTVSHHLAHAYSAFAACPFDEGVVMVVDGVGNYSSDVTEPGQLTDNVNPLARPRVGELLQVRRLQNRNAEEDLAQAGARISERRVLLHARSRCAVQPGLDLHFCALEQVRRGDGLGALRPPPCGQAVARNQERRGGRSRVGRRVRQAILARARARLGSESIDAALERRRLARSRRRGDLAPQARDLAARSNRRQEPVHGRRRCPQLRGQRADRPIVREAGFDNVWIQPAAGDDGIAIGCAYYGYLAILKKQRSSIMTHAYLGAPYTDEGARAAARKWLVRLQTINTPSKNICRDTARLLAEGHVFAWFQGRSEFGPRALGNRSILADPRHAEMKDKLNKRVKHRQAFRPFAPVVLAERANEIFEGDEESPFMLLVKRVRPEWKDKIPAIVHVDGTARVQTVRRDQNERLYGLLEEFDAITGVPDLLNTSLNVKGEPIVETPAETLACFLGTGIDYLALHDMLISKNRFRWIFSPFRSAYSEMSSVVQRGLAVEIRD